jgi:hypothetical protein
MIRFDSKCGAKILKKKEKKEKLLWKKKRVREGKFVMIFGCQAAGHKPYFPLTAGHI